MSQTAISVQVVSETSAALTLNSCDSGNGNKVTNHGGGVFLVLKNTDESNSASVTVTAQGTTLAVPGYGPMTKANLTVSLSSGDEKIVGPFSESAWNNSNGDLILAISGSGAANVKIAPLKLIHY